MAKKKMDMKLIVMAVALIAVVLVFGQDFLRGETRTVTMDGQYTEQVAPDKVEVTFSVVTRAPTASAAQDENTGISNEVISAFKSAGYSDADIQTEYYSVYAEYDWSDDRQDITGYVANHQMKVNNSDIYKAGSIVDTAVSRGATEVNYVDFSLSQETEHSYRVGALSKASENAREKAEAVAEGLGLSVVRVVSVSEGDVYYPPYRIGYAEAVSDAGGVQKAVQLTPGNVEVSAYVMVTFEIA